MGRGKQKKETPVTLETAETPETLEVTLETAETPEGPALPCCMNCGRVLLPTMQRYTVKYRKKGIAIVCPICAQSSTVRLKTPYISVDAARLLKLGKEWS